MKFWETKTLAEMTPAEWESLCDGCGLCCLIRFEDEDTGEVIPTRVHCQLFDPERCRCSSYETRRETVPDCVQLTPGNIADLPWMPLSCAYRRLHEGRGLASWHPLVSGDPESVHRAGRVYPQADGFGADAERGRGRAGFRGAGVDGRAGRRIAED